VLQERKCKSGLGVSEERIKSLRAPGRSQQLRWNEGMKSIDARELVYASAFYMCPQPCASVGPSMQMQLSSGVVSSPGDISPLLCTKLFLSPPSLSLFFIVACAPERANSTYFRALEPTLPVSALWNHLFFLFFSSFYTSLCWKQALGGAGLTSFLY